MDTLATPTRPKLPPPFTAPEPAPARSAGVDPLAAELDAEERVAEVVVRWGEGAILEVRHLRAGESFRAGDSEAVVRALPDRAEIELPRGVALARAGVVLGEGVHAIAEGESATFEVAGLRYLVRSMRAGRRVAAHTAIDRRPFAYVGGVGVFAAVLFGVFALQPPRAGALSTDVIDTGHRLIAHYVAAQESRVEPTPSVAHGTDGGQVGGQAAGETGTAGTPSAPRRPRRAAIPGSADPRDQRLGSVSANDVRHVGVLGVLAGLPGFAGPASPYASATAIGSDPIAALGAVLGTTPGDSAGLFGLGLAGSGSGGGDHSNDTIGVGRFRTVGNARHVGELGGCIGGVCERQGRVPAGVDLGRPEPRGSLSAEVIRRVVTRHRSEIRFCYEQALQSRPDLEGRVMARFIISPTGAVTSSMATGSIGHHGVEQCVAQAVRRWSFPAPEDGGVVTVNYPFVFTSGG